MADSNGFIELEPIDIGPAVNLHQKINMLVFSSIVYVNIFDEYFILVLLRVFPVSPLFGP